MAFGNLVTNGAPWVARIDPEGIRVQGVTNSVVKSFNCKGMRVEVTESR
jgi:hypothetical protein